MSESQSTKSSTSTNTSSKSSSSISYKYIIAGGVAAILVGGSMWMLSRNRTHEVPMQNTPNQEQEQEQMHETYEEESQIYDNDRIVEEEEFEENSRSDSEEIPTQEQEQEIQTIPESVQEEPVKKKKKVKRVYNYKKDCKTCSFVKTDPSTGDKSTCKKKIKENDELCYFHKPKQPIS